MGENALVLYGSQPLASSLKSGGMSGYANFI